MNKLILTCLLAFITASCSFFSSTKCSKTCNPMDFGCRKCETMVPVYPPFANEQGMIPLQNPTTKQMVRCYATDDQPAEYCARYFESQNFVRLRDIPYKTADFDPLTKDTFPTRRWREGEQTPRW